MRKEGSRKVNSKGTNLFEVPDFDASNFSNERSATALIERESAEGQYDQIGIETEEFPVGEGRYETVGGSEQEISGSISPERERQRQRIAEARTKIFGLESVGDMPSSEQVTPLGLGDKLSKSESGMEVGFDTLDVPPPGQEMSESEKALRQARVDKGRALMEEREREENAEIERKREEQRAIRKQKIDDIRIEFKGDFDAERDALQELAREAAEEEGLPSSLLESISNRWVIKNPLSKMGAMGIVYDAHDINLDKDAVVKLFPLTAPTDIRKLKRMENEAKILAQITSDNVVRVYDAGSSDEGAWYAMDKVEGPDLQDQIGEKDFSVKEAIDIARQIANGLKDIQRAGIVHRDLKPANILYRAPHISKAGKTIEGKYEIADFGLAKEINEDQVRYKWLHDITEDIVEGKKDVEDVGLDLEQSDRLKIIVDNLLHDEKLREAFIKKETAEEQYSDFARHFSHLAFDIPQSAFRQTKEGAIIGTVVYMSPEQVAGKSIDQSTDIWALGTIMYETLTKRIPFWRESLPELAASIHQETQTPVHDIRKDVPKELSYLIDLMLMKNRQERPNLDKVIATLNDISKKVSA